MKYGGRETSYVKMELEEAGIYPFYSPYSSSSYILHIDLLSQYVEMSRMVTKIPFVIEILYIWLNYYT